MFISYTNRKRREGDISLLCQLLVITFFITTAELLCGIITNLIMGLNIWDYSDMPMNYLGQICLPFTVLWFAISFFGIIAEDFIRIKLFGDSISPLIEIRRQRA